MQKIWFGHNNTTGVSRVPKLYDEDEGVESDEILRQGTCFDRCALDQGDIVDNYDSDGILPYAINVECTENIVE